jgi:RNA polymerase sigma-70 factor (ECF subfamily)
VARVAVRVDHPSPMAHMGTNVIIARLSHMSDDQLLVELRNGDSNALAALFDRFHHLVYSIALKIVRDPAEAEDVSQNVFFEIFRSAAQFDPTKGTCKVWLLQYAYHRAINRRQQLNAKHFYNLASIEDAERATSMKQLNFGRLTQCEVKQLMRQSLAKLNSAQKRVIELATYQGLSMQEISAQTGESVTNVRHHYYRGLKNLRSFIYDTRITLRGVDVGAA